jgi:Uma2 family endonuclease
MTIATVESLKESGMRLFPLTVGKYHEMMDRGILPEGAPYELLDGAIVRKDRSARGENPLTVGHEHIYSVTVLQELGARLRRRGCHMRIQQPISIPPINEPEPDAAIVLGKNEDYAEKLPQQAHVLCVFEVADASLRRDRTKKLQIYARGGIKNYYIVNLRDRVVEMYTEPLRRKAQYASTRIFSITAKIALPTGTAQGIQVAVRRLLPPPSSVESRRKRSAS